MKGHMIVLEDDTDMLEVMSLIFQEEGYQVCKLNHLIEDFSEVERVAPDIMIIDLFMGDKHSSWQFIQNLKVHPTSSRIPIIICTAGKLTPEQLHQSQNQGIPVVYKPFDLIEVLHLVQSLTE